MHSVLVANLGLEGRSDEQTGCDERKRLNQVRGAEMVVFVASCSEFLLDWNLIWFCFECVDQTQTSFYRAHLIQPLTVYSGEGAIAFPNSGDDEELMSLSHG